MSSDTDERAAFEKWAEGEGFSTTYWEEGDPESGYHSRVTDATWEGWMARADSAVPSSHVSGTDEPSESILREALARLVKAVDRKDNAPSVSDDYFDASDELDESMEAARSALAGTPPKDSGNESGALLGAVQRPGGGTE